MPKSCSRMPRSCSGILGAVLDRPGAVNECLELTRMLGSCYEMYRDAPVMFSTFSDT